MNNFNEKILSRITDDFQVLAKVVLRQQNHIASLLDNNKDEALYAEINNDERIIDSLEVKIRNEVINTIVLYNPRATNLRMIISYYDMTAYLERIGDLLLNISNFMQHVDIQGKIFGDFKKILSKRTLNFLQKIMWCVLYLRKRKRDSWKSCHCHNMPILRAL